MKSVLIVENQADIRELDCYLTKPFSPRQLLGLVTRQLG